MPYVALFHSLGCDLQFTPLPFSGHNIFWLRQSDRGLGDFWQSSLRQAHPAQLVWETDDPKRFGRRSWLVIDEIDDDFGKPESFEFPRVHLEPYLGIEMNVDQPLVVFNVVASSPAQLTGLAKGDRITHVNEQQIHTDQELWQAALDLRQLRLTVERDGASYQATLNLPASVWSKPTTAFPTKAHSGRVSVQVEQQEIHCESTGVSAFRLLISPQAFDFKAPIKVVVNGVTAFDDIVRGDPSILMKWASIDRDPAQLYGAEITIEAPTPSSEPKIQSKE